MDPQHKPSRHQLEAFSVDWERAHSSQPVDSLAAWVRTRNKTHNHSNKVAVYLVVWVKIHSQPSRLNSNKPVGFLEALVRARQINSSHSRQVGSSEGPSRLNLHKILDFLEAWVNKINNKVVLVKINNKVEVYSIIQFHNNKD